MADRDGSRFNLEHLKGQVFRIPRGGVCVAHRRCFCRRAVGAGQGNRVGFCGLRLVAVEDGIGVDLFVAHHRFVAGQLRHSGDGVLLQWSLCSHLRRDRFDLVQ
ncbi:hypothetical protein U1Q18_022147 [Sarracenia purpurea var. burkii]